MDAGTLQMQALQNVANAEAEANTEASHGESKSPLQTDKEMLYLINDVPPWYTCLALGFQHFLTMLSTAVATPLLIGPSLCMGDSDPIRGYLAGCVLVLSGAGTILQATIGVRLPIVQGPSWAYLPSIIAIMSLPQWKCPEKSLLENMTSEERETLWQPRLAEISGALMVASILQMLLGLTGAVGLLMRLISPITVICTIVILGIGFFETFQTMAAQNWPIALMTMLLVLISSQYMRNISIPLPSCGRGKTTRTQIFKLFPILLGLLIGWGVCAICTLLDLLPADDPARTDVKIQGVYDAVWFRVPWPGQWGLPTFSAGGILGMIAAALASVIESIGDYFACASLCGAPPLPLHAINRGIGIEGVGGIVHGMFGAGVGSTSYSTNIGVIGVTKVGSRRVIIWASLFMILMGISTKFSALFTTIPDPVYAGAFIPLFGMITGMGLSMLQYINLNSSRNIFIVGFTILFSLILPGYVAKNPAKFETGQPVVDQVVFVLLSTGMFVAGFLACILDNTVPGNAVDRGVEVWQQQQQQQQQQQMDNNTDNVVNNMYDIPFLMNAIRSAKWTRWVPFLPTFSGFPSVQKSRRGDSEMANAGSYRQTT